ncbi:hypothetical protein [Eubacterium limosum]|uniref:hypothetical protein n=1 Tax=Eubacterium limosum TaxID=1736 RepID=UPI00371EA3C6
MSAKQYTEYEKQVGGSWLEQHPKTDAEQISDILKFVKFSLQPGFTAYSGRANEIVYNALEKSCTFCLAVSGNIPSGSTTIGIIPEEFRPKKVYTFAGVTGMCNSIQIGIRPTGEIRTWINGDLSGDFFCSGTYYLI